MHMFVSAFSDLEWNIIFFFNLKCFCYIILWAYINILLNGCITFYIVACNFLIDCFIHLFDIYALLYAEQWLYTSNQDRILFLPSRSFIKGSYKINNKIFIY